MSLGDKIEYQIDSQKNRLSQSISLPKRFLDTGKVSYRTIFTPFIPFLESPKMSKNSNRKNTANDFFEQLRFKIDCLNLNLK